MKKKLPIGYSTLSEIITDGCVYIDKTSFVEQLANGGKYYFLSRPRRFGKSSFLDTLKQAFLGNKDLFKGLYLENNWDWNTTYPVIHLSFASGELSNRDELIIKITSLLNVIAASYQLELNEVLVSDKFKELITKLYQKYSRRVVVLIDEYDKPILDNITDVELATQMRGGLRGLYSAIKDVDECLKLVFITGVSKFSKVNLFSGLNNLNDISLDARYADICGYTQANIENEFAEYVEAGKVNLAKLKKWYNGYNFLGTDIQKVYNPFDILLFFDKNYIYRNYWFETATPTFLVKLMEKNHYFIPGMEALKVSDKSLGTFDVGNMPLPTLLFQTGYLTIKQVSKIGTQEGYILTYPNLEVKASLNDSLAEIGASAEARDRSTSTLSQLLNDNNFERLGELFISHFAGIPNNWYVNNDIAHYEGYYASIVYSLFCALGYDLIAEDATNHGRIDLTIKMPDKILIIEFKLSKYGNAKEAIAQIKDRGYPQKYVNENLPIYLVGISFDETLRNLESYVFETFNLDG